MIVSGWLLLLCWSSIDGEQFVGDQEYFYEQDQLEQFDPGKYSMGLSLFSNIFNALKSLCMCLFDKDSLELISYLDSYGILQWVAIASAQHKLWSCNLTNGICNEHNRWLFSNIIKEG
jgi:hypothetical protein